ncbi:Hypothetical protein A7982_11341 [Minicystis rosea]|nr:Hypothetical protein A7982_11341 [Minicystis rosea]
MDGELQIHFEERDFTVATFQSLLIACFRGAMTSERLKHTQTAHRLLARKHPKGFAVVGIIGEEVPVAMPADVRALATAITKEFRPNYYALCEVVVGSGFRAATLRSIVSGIRMVARTTCPAQVFAETGPCARWLGPHMTQAIGAPIDAAALEKAVERARVGAG